ncbi:glycoside hydrolase [Clohesyomyces aquaticus]|uniref:Glucanase n=1 Tax=Clohesyomyces aquaticus TaxID=1231657 RepID=A0A1Y1Z0C4_9PLEO|nr:glycoside hydrolase [Clohesyomyces aquaticus]
MDIWEANRASTAYTPHPCSATQVYACSGSECGSTSSTKYSGICDKDGCDSNPYRLGSKSFYGTGSNYTVDTTQKLTVVTQFYTTDNTANGTLSEIRRIYVQNGKVIQNAKITIPGLQTEGTITDSYCASQKTVLGGTDHFSKLGGLKTMGGALGRGMVLALSIWDDAGQNMGWLDQDPYPADADSSKPGVGRGPCKVGSGKPADLIRDSPDSKVVFSNIRSGEIGSTFVTGTKFRFARD